jgi:hypothetical protein
MVKRQTPVNVLSMRFPRLKGNLLWLFGKVATLVSEITPYNIVLRWFQLLRFEKLSVVKELWTKLIKLSSRRCDSKVVYRFDESAS